jgi:hypothetical protein
MASYSIVSGGTGTLIVTNGSSDWDAAHDATITVSMPSPTLYIDVGMPSALASVAISRMFFSFDTRLLDSNHTIVSANLYFYPTSRINQDNDGDDWINVVQSFQASPTVLSGDDFDQCGDAINNPTEGATRIDIGSLTLSAWNNFTLNATGLGWINKANYTTLGAREGHDCIDVQVVNENYVLISNTSSPVLSIVETSPGWTGTMNTYKVI